MIAAPQETRTPIFPRPARCGLLLFAPNPHTIADTMSANTLRMRPTVMTAPTMVRNWLIPGRPELLGSISICIGNNAETTGAASARTVRVFTIQAPSIRGSTVLLPKQVHPHAQQRPRHMEWCGRQGMWLEGRAEVDEPVHPGDCATCEDRGPQRGPGTDTGFRGCTVVAVRGRDRPGDGADDEHEDGDDEHGRQQCTDYCCEVACAADAADIGQH